MGGARREPEPLHKTRKRKKKRNSGLSASRHRPPPPTTNKEGREEEEEESHVKGGRGFELAASESQERVAMGTKEEVESRIREEEALGKL